MVVALVNNLKCSYTLSLELPGPLTITGTPSSAQLPGTVLSLVCRSRGTSPATRLVWYLDDVPMDSSYMIEDSYVTNSYNYTVPSSGMARLECRLDYAPENMQLSEIANISAIGSVLSAFLLAFLQLSF